MSISKAWLSSWENRMRAAALYRDVSRLLTIAAIAEELGTSHQTIGYSLHQDIPTPERKLLAAVRLSASKTGTKNPMRGKTQEQHHNWVGDCSDAKGYLTRLHHGKRVFVHRIVMAEALGLRTLPSRLVVHHIDGDPLNNRLDNLALTTKVGHKMLHTLQVLEPTALQSRRATIAELVASSISQSKRITPSSSKE